MNRSLPKAKLARKPAQWWSLQVFPAVLNIDYVINKMSCRATQPYKAIAYPESICIRGRSQRLLQLHFQRIPRCNYSKTLKTEPYRILIVADMFQTGLDEPLLHTMYVDKIKPRLSKRRQTLIFTPQMPSKNVDILSDFWQTKHPSSRSHSPGITAQLFYLARLIQTNSMT